MKLIRAFAHVALLATALAGGSAQALVLFSDSSNITAHGSAAQLGRLSRNGVPQDWAGTEPYPGAINLTTQYFYTTYSIFVGNTPFIQVEFDSDSADTFISAYLGVYNPSNLALNWRGDEGFSGNPFPGSPSFFQVAVPINSTIVIVINNTATGGVGVTDPYGLLVEGFIDTEYNDPRPTVIPEPSTALLAPLALAALLAARQRRNKRREKEEAVA